MKAILASIVAFPILLLFLAMPMMGGSDALAASACTPTGGDPLQVTGSLEAWESYDAEQMTNAATIVAVGAEKNIPPRGQQIAVMTAIGESGLRNLTGGDRDSVGLFQQRPSMGWGTAEEILDPEYASGQFYDRLVTVKGWETMSPATNVAHAVQGNADPNYYQQFWGEAGAMLAHLGSAASSSSTTGSTGTVGSSEAPGPGSTTATVPDVQVAQANVKQFASDIATVQSSGVDFVTLSETSQVPEAQLAINGYQAFKAAGGNVQARSTAVAWRADRWSMVAGGRVLLTADGPQKWDAGRSASWVTLTDSTGAQISVISVHMMINPAIYGPNPQRQALYLAGMDQLGALVAQLSAVGPVLVGGDLNSRYQDNDPWGPRTQLAKVGLRPSFDTAGVVATHDGGATIDYLFAPTSAAVTAQNTMPQASDHRALYVGLEFSEFSASSTTAPGIYCDTSISDNGGAGFEVNAAVPYVGPYPPAQLRARAAAFAAGGGGWYQKCQNFVAQLAGRPFSGFASAASAMGTFQTSGLFHSANSVDGYAPPIGAWLYYSNSGNPYGHVATYLGNGEVAGTDTWRTDYVDIGPASDITAGIWQLTYEGWAVPWATSSTDVPVMAPAVAASQGGN